jgi:hypothetical protein
VDIGRGNLEKVAIEHDEVGPLTDFERPCLAIEEILPGASDGVCGDRRGECQLLAGLARSGLDALQRIP